jgi:hypothetical protein
MTSRIDLLEEKTKNLEEEMWFSRLKFEGLLDTLLNDGVITKAKLTQSMAKIEAELKEIAERTPEE